MRRYKFVPPHVRRIPIRLIGDIDADGVIDYKDCKPLDFHRQHPKEEKLRMLVSITVHDTTLSATEKREELMEIRGICQGFEYNNLVAIIDDELAKL